MGYEALTSTSLGIRSQNFKTSKVFKSGKNLKNRSFKIVKSLKILKNLSFSKSSPPNLNLSLPSMKSLCMKKDGNNIMHNMKKIIN